MSNELGLFLRSRREAVTPSAVGLPAGTRRRTPGLRRSELSTLAGISVDYLVRLEQGRDKNPSAQVLAAIADALRLGDDDRGRLRHYAAVTHAAELCPTRARIARTVHPPAAAVLDRLESTPAIVINRLVDVLATTESYAALMRPTGLFETEPVNLVRFALEDARAADVFPERDLMIDAHVGLLTGACETDLTELADEIGLAGPDALARHWERRLLSPAPGVMERIRHPTAGELRTVRQVLTIADADDQRIVVFLPADDSTSAALDHLVGRRRGVLRAVQTG